MTLMTAPKPATSWSQVDTVVLLALLLMAACVFLMGITWGLPSRNVDPYLFGDHPVWTGAQIIQLAPESSDSDRGADVDANPITDRSHPILLNETDSQRAEIVRRYRLFSYQPDEMITFKSLSGMHPSHGDFDPRLYQYGGLWIYPVGVLLKLSSLVHLIDLRPDKAWYLDHPEQFGRFYIVARAYSAAWGLIGVVAIYALLRPLTASRLAAGVAGTCYIWMPVVINAAHEAKPHLAGTVLILLAILAGARYIDTGSSRWSAAAGGLCGAALGMVLSGLWAFAILPVMIFLRSDPPRLRFRRLLLSLAVGILVYLITNPYVPLDAIFHPARLTSNLHNSTAMYAIHGSSSTLLNALHLIAEGASPIISIAGAVGVLALMARRLRRNAYSHACTSLAGYLLATVSLIVLLQFVLLAGGKPGEYGRFALLPDIALAITAIIALATARLEFGPILRTILLSALCLIVIPYGAQYSYAFRRDTRLVTSRLRTAEDLKTLPGSIGLRDEPAPYLMPPVNLFERNLILLPRSEIKDKRLTSGINFILTPVDQPDDYPGATVLLPARWNRGPFLSRATPISWANKRFALLPIGGFLSQSSNATQIIVADSDPH